MSKREKPRRYKDIFKEYVYMIRVILCFYFFIFFKAFLGFVLHVYLCDLQFCSTRDVVVVTNALVFNCDLDRRTLGLRLVDPPILKR